MKVLLVLCLFGFAAASVYENIIEIQSRKAVKSFRQGLDEVESLVERLGLENSEFAGIVAFAEGEVKKELVEKLKEKLDELLRTIKDKVDHHGDKIKDGLDKAKNIIDELKQLGEDIGVKAKEFFEDLKDKLHDFFKNLLQKSEVPVRRKGLVEDWIAFYRDLKAQIDSTASDEDIANFIEQRVSPGMLKTYLLWLLNALGRDSLRDYVVGSLPDESNVHQKRALKDVIQRFFELLEGRVVTEWIADLIGKGAENSGRSMGIIEDMIKLTSLDS